MMKIKNAVATMDRKRPFFRFLTFLFLFFTLFLTSCEYDNYPVPPPPPPPAHETTMLEAKFVTTPPTALNSSYWKNADWKKVTASNSSTLKLYAEGMLNMTGTYNGTSSFNSGTSPDITMKAAYDEQKLYVLVEWKDNDFNPALAAAQWDGKADPLKTDNTDEWTSQGNSDKLALAFDISNATYSDGKTFSQVGCAAACHTNSATTMITASGKADIWCWDFAISEPLGYARDMIVDASGIADDAGQPMFTKNKVTVNDNRSAPAYEWDGTEQNISRPDGKTAKLDPAYFLLNKTLFTGDPALGKLQFHNATYGCNHCHGENGEGDEAPQFNTTSANSTRSRAQMMEYASTHEGANYYLQVPSSERDNLMAYIRGLGSLPGNYINTPTGSNTDVWTVSSVKLTKVNVLAANTKYQVLFIRNLLTGKTDDVQFSAPEAKEFIFGIALMDGDGKNHIGSNKEVLKFLIKE